MTCRDEHIIRIVDIQTKRYGDSDHDVSSRVVSLDQFPTDEEALRFPWAVLASMGGLAYLWMFPGLIGR